ncbi:MAG: 5-methyltetrahydropteroyltriglutamate--homocysteine S-methyltransferase [Deferribacteraceae bacterium]|jgi:5-methyltetrahydropteroyltriglutamate--homocysteine methyltransferase|nr:5-methyltetrahydropteroyltriglutamate--homocysteine S-methyltransferase [Deferribacteraceae bacterium]
MKKSVIGFPRIGKDRELKSAAESYFSGKLTENDLLNTARALRSEHWKIQKTAGIDFIPSNDFSFYDNMLDTAVLFNAVPKRYKELELNPLEEYFAMARGYQGDKGDVKALAMKKWYNTNYHYLVAEIEDSTEIKLTGSKPFDEFLEAKSQGILTKPVVIGIYTFLKLARLTGAKTGADIESSLISAYKSFLERFSSIGAQWLQFDEPSLVMDMTEEDTALFTRLYAAILSSKGALKILLQTYFGDIRDCYAKAVSLSFDGIGLDFTEGRRTEALIAGGFPADKILFAGIINGKNIWKNNYKATLDKLTEIRRFAEDIVLSTSCSLLHVPYTLESETDLAASRKKHFAFAREKLTELSDLSEIISSDEPFKHPKYLENAEVFAEKRGGEDARVQEKTGSLKESDFIRLPPFAEREKAQKEKLRLPPLATTTIGSFPQTADVRSNRAAFRAGKISEEEYTAFNKKKIAECIALQEKIGLDVIVHGEFERNDMVEYFGENLNGFLFTKKAWVQSYGTRCVKPPIIWGDISRTRPITVGYSVYAQSLTNKPVKGMLTGPVTILSWSFPREDIPLNESTLQIALAIREEVLDLEKNGIKVIQIDEAALREKLPLRKSDWHSEYLNWVIPAFRLVHSGVKAETQIHTHMCYSEFTDIIPDIDAMDADVISFEASRSDLLIIDALKAANFKTEVGPGVYDIHSPRIPSVEEIKTALLKMLEKLPKEKLWVNPDCGLKTRGEKETVPSLENLAAAAKEVRGK